MERRGGLARLMARLDIGGQLDKLIFLIFIYNNNNNIEFRDYLGQRGDDSRDKVIDSKANEH
ncbi:hypothetical protein YC2023_027006 [Brassica napus]